MQAITTPILASVLSERADKNIEWLVAAVALTFAALALAWIYLPRTVKRFIVWIDVYIPGDLTSMAPLTARLATLAATGLILMGLSLSLANSLGADTSDFLQKLQDIGIAVGDWFRTRFLKIGIVILAAMIGIRIIRRAIPNVIGEYVRQQSRPGITKDEIDKRQRTLESVAIHAFGSVIVTLATFTVLAEIGLNVGPVLAAAGIAGVAIGFGAQNVVRDVLAGVFILLEDQYRVGDVIQVAGIGGMVEEVTLRRTVLRDLEAAVHIIPNGEIKLVTNRTKDKARMAVDLEVAYKEDIDRCIAVINRVGEEISSDPTFAPLITSKIKVLRVQELAASGVVLRVLGETVPLKHWDIEGEFRRRIKKAFDEEGIEIPFPHTTVYWGKGQKPGH